MPTILQPPPGFGRVELGRTIPSLLREAVEERPNAGAFQQRTDSGWRPLSNEAFRERAQAIALGLRAAGLAKGDRVALYVHNDVGFCLADMACLMAGVVDVPIHLTHTSAAVEHILEHSQSRALIVSDAELYDRIRDLVPGMPNLELLLTVEDVELPDATVETTSFAGLGRRGRDVLRDEPDAADRMEDALEASDLATIMYTSGTTGTPKGVLLTHENVSSNAISSLTGLSTYRSGADEISLSFLPLSHIFQRTLQYAAMWYGTSVHFGSPETLRDDLQTVAPTFFACVPRVLERAFERIQAKGGELTGVQRMIFDWSMGLADRYEVAEPPSGVLAAQLKMADRLVFAKWREALGGRVRTVIVGGAAVRPKLVNAFGAAGLDVLQGYGLTETSPVIAFNRPETNSAGTVGPILAGTEVMIADDDEILTRGPHVMQGYYRDPELTRQVLDDDGWLRTGDLGAATDRGFLRVTGRKKSLFKLSTGKYVMSQVVEERLEAQPLIEHALVVGEGEKFCAAIAFVSAEAFADRFGPAPDLPRRLTEERVKDAFGAAIRRAQEDLPVWSQVRRVALVGDRLTPEGGMLTPKLSMKRPRVREAYGDVVDALYGRTAVAPARGVIVDVVGADAKVAA